MANKREALLKMIAFFESIGKVVEADTLREIITNLHDARVVIKHGIDNNLLAAGKIPEGATTTIGNICAELGKNNESPSVIGLDALLEVVKDIRKSDCGAWLKDCNGIHSCSEGKEKRQELMRLLDKLYKAASTKRPEEGEKAIRELDKANDLINALYESGCLDLQREELVQEYLRG